MDSRKEVLYINGTLNNPNQSILQALLVINARSPPFVVERRTCLVDQAQGKVCLRTWWLEVQTRTVHLELHCVGVQVNSQAFEFPVVSII
jgi:hypothetical protein